MKHFTWLSLFVIGVFLWTVPGFGKDRVFLNFQDVDLPIFAKYMSEVMGTNIIIDEKVKGKISIFSPVKVSRKEAYGIFLSALELKGLAAIRMGRSIQIVPAPLVRPNLVIKVYNLKYASAEELKGLLSSLMIRPPVAARASGVGQPILRRLQEIDSPIQILADKPTNSLIIRATQSAHALVKPVIEELDIQRNQVYVEAVILEIAVDRLRQIGTDPLTVLAFGQEGAVSGILGLNRDPQAALQEISQAAGALIGTGAASSAFFPDSINGRLFLHFLLNLTDTNLLSTPQILAADNEQARIVVGENRPFPTGQSQTVGGNTLVTIERKDVGVTLEITPRLMGNGKIRLKVRQEITAIQTNVAQTIGTGDSQVAVGPTTTKRAMDSTVLAQDGQTLVLGGLIRDNITINESKLPFLGDIPGLGWLFKFEERRSEKISLLIFLTPHLVRNESDVESIRASKNKDLNRLLLENRITEEGDANSMQLREKLLPFGEGG